MSLKTSSLLFPSSLGNSRTSTASLSGLGLAVFLCVSLCSAALAQVHFTGAYTVVPSSGLYPCGVAVGGSGTVYVADANSNRVVMEIPSAEGYTQTVVATNTALSGPHAVATDASGNLYIADTLNNRVLKEVPSTSGGVTTWVETTVANLDVNGVDLPTSVAVDSNNAVYIASFANNVAVKMTPVVGGGYSEAVMGEGLQALWGIAVDASFNVYLADYLAGKIYELPWTGTAYGEGVLIQSGLIRPTALAVDASGTVWVADSGHDWIYKDTPSSGGGFSGSSLIPGLANPDGIAVDPQGNVYVADTANSRILKVPHSVADFGPVNIGSPSAEKYTLTFAFDEAASVVPWAATQGAFGRDFTDAGTGTCTTNGQSHLYQNGDMCTLDVTFTPSFAGTRYGAGMLLDNYDSAPLTVAGANANLQGTGVGPQVTFRTSNQQPSSVGSGLSFPDGLAVDPAGNLHVGDTDNGSVNEMLAVGGNIPATPVFSTQDSSQDGSW